MSHADEQQRSDVRVKCETMRGAGVQNIYLFATLLSIYEKAQMTKDALEVMSVLKAEDVPRASYWAFREKLLLSSATGDN